MFKIMFQAMVSVLERSSLGKSPASPRYRPGNRSLMRE